MPVIIEITDPVGGFKYTLDTRKKIAHRQAIPPMPSRAFNGAGGGVGIGIGGGKQGAETDLGAAIPAPMMAEGNAAVGTALHERKNRHADHRGSPRGRQLRSTVTYPVGAMGNDREFSAVTERWMSPDLEDPNPFQNQ